MLEDRLPVDQGLHLLRQDLKRFTQCLNLIALGHGAGAIRAGPGGKETCREEGLEMAGYIVDETEC
jgi:hypothetical protein